MLYSRALKAPRWLNYRLIWKLCDSSVPECTANTWSKGPPQQTLMAEEWTTGKRREITLNSKLCLFFTFLQSNFNKCKLYYSKVVSVILLVCGHSYQRIPDRMGEAEGQVWVKSRLLRTEHLFPGWGHGLYLTLKFQWVTSSGLRWLNTFIRIKSKHVL